MHTRPFALLLQLDDIHIHGEESQPQRITSQSQLCMGRTHVTPYHLTLACSALMTTREREIDAQLRALRCGELPPRLSEEALRALLEECTRQQAMVADSRCTSHIDAGSYAGGDAASDAGTDAASGRAAAAAGAGTDAVSGRAAAGRRSVGGHDGAASVAGCKIGAGAVKRQVSANGASIAHGRASDDASGSARPTSSSASGRSSSAKATATTPAALAAKGAAKAGAGAAMAGPTGVAGTAGSKCPETAAAGAAARPTVVAAKPAAGKSMAGKLSTPTAPVVGAPKSMRTDAAGSKSASVK